MTLVGKVDQFQQLGHALFDGGLADLLIFQPKGDVAGDGQVGKQRI